MSASATTSASAENFKNVSIFKYFTSELTRGYLLEREEEKYAQKRQRVYTFMKTPRELEKFCIYGFFQCVDAFLFVFTFLPLRIMLAFLKLLTQPCGFTRSRSLLQPAQICDILKGIILVVCCFIMSYIDTSMMYHLVRGQATIKLYVFFNMLDMADRLLSNFGHDILDALFWTATEPRDRRREHLGTLPHLILAIIYVIIHTMLILFQATVLNVAFNSYNKALLVIMMSNNTISRMTKMIKKFLLEELMYSRQVLHQQCWSVAMLTSNPWLMSNNPCSAISNFIHLSFTTGLHAISLCGKEAGYLGRIFCGVQFVEIKGSLFRKVDLNHLYQIGCSDVKERFHYVVLLSLVCVRNLTEAKWDLDIMWVLLPDALLVLLAEVFVDWGKHAFILKFNEIPADVYREYKVKLALDMAASRQKQAFTDHSDLVSRRMGLTPIPLACLIFRILTKSIKLTTWMGYLILFVIFICLTTFKVLNSIILLGHSYKVIEEYDQQQTESSTNQSTETTESTNPESTSDSTNGKQDDKEVANEEDVKISAEILVENISTVKSDITEKFVKHERSASCDANVSRNFSEILMADSYTELTMISNIDVIEHSKDPTLLSKSTIKESSSEDFFDSKQETPEQEELPQSTAILENGIEVDFPVQETVITAHTGKEGATFNKSERFFVNINQRKPSSRKDLSEEEGEDSDESNDQISDDDLNSCVDGDHIKSD